MKYPYLNEIPTTKQTIDVFRGYNHNLRIESGEFYEMENMTSDFYPVLSPRGARGVYKTSELALDNIIGKGKLCYSDGQSIAVGDTVLDGVLPQGADHDFVSMGAYMIAFSKRREPAADEALNAWTYVNTEDTAERGELGSFGYSGDVRYTLCESNGAPLTPIFATDSSGVPNSGRIHDLAASLCREIEYVYWYVAGKTTDGAGDVREVYRCHYVNDVFSFEKIQPYVAIRAGGINRRRESGENVRPLSLDDGGAARIDENNVIGAAGEIPGEYGGGYITVKGTIEPEESDFYTKEPDGADLDREYANFKEAVQDNQIDYVVKGASVEFASYVRIPYMDYVCERGNRLWGCRYGKNDVGDFVNEIYASALGNFEQWYRFEGDANDSYQMTVGSDGPFTGCAAFGDCTVFFKENCIHKVYGMYPEQYYSVDVEAPGVERGSHRSIVSMDGVLYYKSPHGVRAYDGSLPVEISEPLGNVSYSDAVACGFDGKYYVSMKDTSGGWHLFVYDTRRPMWHREDDTRMVSADVFEGNMYYSDGNTIRTVRGEGTEAVKWRCETGNLGDESPERKYMSKINVRMSLDIGSVVRFYARYDSLSEPEHICTLEGDTLQTFTIPIRLRRCDHMSLIIEGEGEAKIYSITKVIEKGSDVV